MPKRKAADVLGSTESVGSANRTNADGSVVPEGTRSRQSNGQWGSTKSGKSAEGEILEEKATGSAKWIEDWSAEGDELKQLIVLAAAHLIKSWAMNAKITSRDAWPVAGVLVALGDVRDLSLKTPKTDKHRAMNGCLLRVQRWVRDLEVFPDQADEITANINTLSKMEKDKKLKWDGDSTLPVHLDSLKKRLAQEVTDLCPRDHDAEPILKRLGTRGASSSVWSNRIHSSRKEPYPSNTGCPFIKRGRPAVGSDGEDTVGNVEEALLALAMQIGLKMAVRCAPTIALSLLCTTWSVRG